MPATFNLSGRRFGRLLVESSATRKVGERGWRCLCDCGQVVKYIPTGSLTSGRTKSCGCGIAISARIHGKTGSPEFKAWISMLARCYCKTTGNYGRYGGVGIRVCRRWRHSFANFLKDMGEKPTGRHSLDRIDNAKGYSPDNCRWATTRQQSNNQTRNRVIRFQGKTLTLGEWSEKLGLRYKTLQMRLTRGWSVAEAFEIPIDKARSGPGIRFLRRKESD